jgi:Zn finger protein HypA/HybF involved in hydrogenase expression
MSNSIVRKDKFGGNHVIFDKRIIYISKLMAHIPSQCPECSTELEVDDEQIYCPHCGLITQDSYDFHAGQHFHLPHGIRLG